MLGALFWVIGVLVALASLVGFGGSDAPSEKTILLVLLFYGLGGGVGPVVAAWPWHKP